MSMFSYTEQERTPTKGLRQKVRIALREAGVTEKFQINILRNKKIAVISAKVFSLPITKYESQELVFVQREK